MFSNGFCILLTFSQVILLAGALPQRSAIGQCWNISNGVNKTLSVISTQPSALMLIDELLAEVITTTRTSTTSFVTSVITIGQERVITSTSLPDVQTPATTSAGQDTPNTGVS